MTALSTGDLIAALAADARPVRRLRPPVLRAAGWLAFALAVIAVVVALSDLRDDLGEQLGRMDFVLEWAASIATGVTAAIAAVMISLPDRSARWALLPVPPLLLWGSTIGYGCLTEWLRHGPDGLVIGRSFECFVSIVGMSVPILALFAVMARHAALVRPRLTATVGALAAAGLAAAGLALFHNVDATIMDFILHVLAVGLVVLAADRGHAAMFRAVDRLATKVGMRAAAT
jgi:hypothetical protein